VARRGVALLRFFVNFVDQLETIHDLKAMSSTLSITVDASGPRAQITGPDPHVYRSFLIDARKLFTKSEDSDLARICPEALRVIHEPVAHQAIADACNDYQQIRLRSYLRVVVDDHEVMPAEMVDLMIQGSLFHEDAAKLFRLEDIVKNNPMTATVIEDQVRWFINQTVAIAVWIASVIDHEDQAGRFPA
jgi:hypothetical protein